jgi:RHS repeat-associated protein
VIQERASGGAPLVSYTRRNDLSGSLEGAGGIGGLLARSDGYSSGNFTNHAYYFADGNGNITYLVNGAQSLAASYRYDPFGSLISSSGSLASTNVYRFSSKEIHANSGMYYYLYRFYDPNLQRWTSRDPAFDQGWNLVGRNSASESPVNWYRFCENAPVALIDPLGLKIWLCTRAAFGGKAGRHSYLWDDRDLPQYKNNPRERSCGQESSLGSGSSGRNKRGDNCPMPGFSDPVYHGGGDSTCYPVDNSDGKENGIRQCCEDNNKINAGVWFPFINDCHNRAIDCLEQGGMFPSEIPAHPRFGKGNYAR